MMYQWEPIDKLLHALRMGYRHNTITEIALYPQAVLDLIDAIENLRRAPTPDMVLVPSIELSALRELFVACGRTIHVATTSGSTTLNDINDAWAGVCSAQISIRASSPAKEGGAA